MQKNNAKKKNALKPIYKPYLTGKAFSSLALKRGLKVLGLLLVFAFFGILASGVFSFENPIPRILLNGALLFFGCMVMFNEGSRIGENDVSYAEIALKRQNEGLAVTDTDRQICYHRLKGFVSALAGAAPLLLITVIYALTVQRQTMSLGALPSWVQGYENQDEIGQALAFYHESSAAGFTDFLRLAVRLVLFPYMNMIGAGNFDRLYLLDRLSPLLVLIIPLCYGVGYLRGTYLRALVHGNIRMARRRHKRSERKAREQRVRKQPQKKELI